MTALLLMQVPSGKMRIGNFVVSSTCAFNLQTQYKKSLIYGFHLKINQQSEFVTNLLATALLSLISDLSNQIWEEARANARWRTPRKPPWLCPIYTFKSHQWKYYSMEESWLQKRVRTKTEREMATWDGNQRSCNCACKNFMQWNGGIKKWKSVITSLGKKLN